MQKQIATPAPSTPAAKQEKRKQGALGRPQPRATASAAASGAKQKAPLTVSRKELLTDGSDSDFRRLVHALLPFLAVHTAIRDGYASALGLAGPQYTILLCIRNLTTAGPVSVKMLADHLRLSGSFITAETNVLERKGLIVKGRAETDRRMVSLSLTAAGIELLDSIAPLRRQVNDVQFECLTAEEFKMLVPLIERLVISGERALALQGYLRTGQSPAGTVSS